jgi:hypothetical protein
LRTPYARATLHAARHQESRTMSVQETNGAPFSLLYMLRVCSPPTRQRTQPGSSLQKSSPTRPDPTCWIAQLSRVQQARPPLGLPRLVRLLQASPAHRLFISPRWDSFLDAPARESCPTAIILCCCHCPISRPDIQRYLLPPAAFKLHMLSAISPIFRSFP